MKAKQNKTVFKSTANKEQQRIPERKNIKTIQNHKSQEEEEKNTHIIPIKHHFHVKLKIEFHSIIAKSKNPTLEKKKIQVLETTKNNEIKKQSSFHQRNLIWQLKAKK